VTKELSMPEPELIQRHTSRARTVCDLFDQQVRSRPDAVAVRTASLSWTYAEFDRITARLAHRLRRRGVGPGAVVGLLAPRSALALVGLVATIRSGAACLALAPGDPVRRNQEVLADAGCEHVLVAEPRDWLPGAQLLDDASLIDEKTAVADLPAPSPLDLAYAITTSGSTGRPKVVGIPHQGILNLVLASMEDLDLIRDTDVMLWTAAPTVDITMQNCLMALSCGAAVAIADGDDLPANRMLSATRALGGTVLDLPAAVIGPYGGSLLPRLADAGARVIIVGGSQLDGPGLGQSAGELSLQNAYGPTETTVAATFYRCTPSTPNWVPIGRPVRGVRTYVLDGNLEPVPDGTDGQLFIAGIGLARGYLGLPARTAGAFLPDPVTNIPGQRMYATGDRVSVDSDGNLVFLGRIDDQVKIRGFRVEIGEVEHAVRECPGVVDVAVLLREDAPGGAALAAYLVGERSSDDTITDRLRDRLPGHMIPRSYVWLDEMPLNRPGKIDRAALAAIPLAHPDGEDPRGA
jgi:amino acid adenylation domain-containing protein